ncbi:MAG: TatD family hydrolase [Vampirovibrionales bacterium]|nr:TatD family hydrolase [Vampirovibrionales bacterium]
MSPVEPTVTCPPFIDTHCHLDYLVDGLLAEAKPAAGPTDAASILSRAMQAGIVALINPATEPERFPRVCQMAEAHDNVWMALAIHPTDVQHVAGLTAENAHDVIAEMLLPYLSHPKLVALGETGLDYYHLDTPDIKTLQKACFRAFLTLSKTYGLPVIIHDREAHDDVASLVAEVLGPYDPQMPPRGVMHCFSGDEDFAARMVALGFCISFAGNLTFKKAQPLRDAALSVPLNWLLVETDAPFLSPEPWRGLLNEPARTVRVATMLADLKQLSLETLSQVTLANTQRVFARMHLAQRS